MSITKVWIEDGCICCGMSSDTYPEVFEIPDDHDINVVKENVDFLYFCHFKNHRICLGFYTALSKFTKITVF